MADFLGLNAVADGPDIVKLLLRLFIDVFFLTLVIRGVYYRVHSSREYIFTYYLLNLITFFLCLLLRKVPTELGFALAIFAVFGVLRYRTEQIRIRDLTYLFIVIGIGIINAIANKSISVIELLIVNAAIAVATAWLEYRPFGARESSTLMLYDNLSLFKSRDRAMLLQDIRERTGLDACRVDVESVDLLRDAVELRVYYHSNESGGHLR